MDNVTDVAIASIPFYIKENANTCSAGIGQNSENLGAMTGCQEKTSDMEIRKYGESVRIRLLGHRVSYLRYVLNVRECGLCSDGVNRRSSPRICADRADDKLRCLQCDWWKSVV